MGKKAGIALATVAGVVVLAGYAASPLIGFGMLRSAAQAGDRDRLEQAVDFPAVRESLKSQISAGVVKAVGSDPSLRGNPLGALGAMLVPALTGR
jgi:hypothetical protein